MPFMNPDDRWAVSGRNILAPRSLAALRDALEKGLLIVEHRFYYGARSPERKIFDDFEDLETYLKGQASPGDSVWVWDFDALCRDDNFLAQGKIPDDQGRVPETGAY